MQLSQLETTLQATLSEIEQLHTVEDARLMAQLITRLSLDPALLTDLIDAMQLVSLLHTYPAHSHKLLCLVLSKALNCCSAGDCFVLRAYLSLFFNWDLPQ